MLATLVSPRARRTASIRLRQGAVTLAVVLIAACRPSSPRRAPAADQQVLALMECYECMSGELDSVVALGSAVVALLRSSLVDGPEAGRVARMDSSLRFFTTPRPSDSVISSQIENYRSLYRMRAIRALSAIGGPDAIDALCAGRASPRLTPDDRKTLDAAIQRVGGQCR